MSTFSLKRKFGVELFFDSRRLQPSVIAGMITGVNPESHNYRCGPTNPNWVIRPVNESEHTFKVSSPTMPADRRSLDVIGTVLSMMDFDTLGDEGTRGWVSPITKICPLHLSLDVSDLSPNDILKFVITAYKIEKAIYSIVPSSRKEAVSAMPLRRVFEEEPSSITNLKKLSMVIGDNGRSAISLSKYLGSGSVEIRYSAGTSNPSKVNFWLILWASILEKSIRRGAPVADIDTFEGLATWLGWPEEGQDLLAQARKFLGVRAETLQSRKRSKLKRELTLAEAGIIPAVEEAEETENCESGH